MNSIRKCIFLLSLASLPFTGGGLFAQTANEGTFKLRALKSSNQSRTASESKEKMRIGYCTTDVSRGLIAQITGSHTYHAATYLSADVLNKYVGDKIESIEFAISPKRGHMAEYFICTDLKDMQGTTLAQGASTTYKEGWNKMSFKNPVTIKKNMNLYIGYILYLEDGEDYDCLLFDESRYAVPGGNWYGYDMNWFSNTNGIGKNICIRAVVSGNTVPNNDVSLMKLTSDDGGEYVEQNKPKSYIAYIQNNGTTTAQGTAYINALRTRANATTQTAYSLRQICDEWSREFYFEGLRRTTLIRFGYFGGNVNYNWSWKGGVDMGRWVRLLGVQVTCC